jgi:tetratricopeptide (TPR) repeat protein
VLAAALARDPEIRRAYPDGIIWVSVRQQPNVVGLQLDVARHLGSQELFETEAQGQGVLRQLLAQKAVLFILDDVWSARDVQAFDVLGTRCRALVTTRDAGVLHSLGAQRREGQCVPVSLFTEAEALALLADAVGVERAALPPEAREVVQECGCLPLAVALCGGMVKKRGEWGAILQRLRQADLEKIADREAINEQHRSIWRAMQVSVDVLEADEQRRFAELAVFATDRPVPEAAVRTLWAHTGDLNDLDTTDLIINLAERSLIRLDQTPGPPGEDVDRHISLHDLLYDFATRLAGEPQPLHEALLDAYRQLCPEGWASGPNDGYFRERLPHHLLEVRLWDDLLEFVSSVEPRPIAQWIARGDGLGRRCLTALIKEAGLEPSFRATLATQLARLCGHLGEYDEAERWLAFAIEHSSAEAGRRTHAIALHERGSLRLYRRDFPGAIGDYEAALALCLAADPPDLDEAAANRVALATVATNQYRWDDGLRLASLAREEARQADDVAHLAAADRMRAYVLDSLGRYDEAAEALRAALELSESQAAEAESAHTMMLLGYFHYGQSTLRDGDYSEAVAWLKRGMEVGERVRLAYVRHQACLRRGWCALARDETEGAVQWFGMVPDFAPDARDAELPVGRCLGLAAAAHQSGDLGEAEKLYRTALELTEQCDFRMYRVTALVGLGATLWHTDRPEEGEGLWEQARRLAGETAPKTAQLAEWNIRACRAHPRRAPR